MKIKHLIMDFDGTCTNIPAIHELFLAEYLLQLNQTVFAQNPVGETQWQEAQHFVRQHSPQLGWSIAKLPAAPAAADPYILAYESAQQIARQRALDNFEVPTEVFTKAATAHPAPWREEAKQVFEWVLQQDVAITFISNSSSATVTARLHELFQATELPNGIRVQSGAAKFRIADLPPESRLPAELQAAFNALPDEEPTTLDRPIYLRRGSYFEALGTVLRHREAIPATLCCGDIWEMDLAMPFALGAKVHLLTRAAPYDTYQYEQDRIRQAADRGKTSDDLTGLRAWF